MITTMNAPYLFISIHRIDLYVRLTMDATLLSDRHDKVLRLTCYVGVIMRNKVGMGHKKATRGNDERAHGQKERYDKRSALNAFRKIGSNRELVLAHDLKHLLFGKLNAARSF